MYNDMITREINYFHKKTSDIEIIYYKNSHISYPEHNHISVYSVGLVIAGYIKLIQKGETAFYQTNHVYAIQPYEPHAIISGEDGYTMLSICLNKHIFSKRDTTRVLLELTEITDDLTSTGILNQVQAKLIFNQFYELYQSFLHQQIIINDTFSFTRNLLETNPESELNLEELSQISFASKYHFIREFKKEVGLTPHQFQIQNRIRKSQKLLLQNCSITEVALATGFYDQSHFNKCFKKIVGLTPSQYLQAYTLLQN